MRIYLTLYGMKGVHPSVLLIEEAGQVLEAHVIGSLVRSIEHVIMIGDPFQLRPTISNYGSSKVLCNRTVTHS
jgi:superfamily I DNA and/or RNA helicase